jgi:hypothetical protein
MKKILSLLFSFLFVMPGFAQDSRPEMADAFRSSGKIYVVVCVAAIVLTGLIIYLISIDRKVGRIEREIESKRKEDITSK